MRIENRTGRAVWVGLYDLNDQVYGRTTLPGMTREPLGSGTTGTFTPKPDKLQIVFWTHRKLGRQLTTPKEVLTTEAAIAEDTGAFYVYNHLGAPTPADRNAAAGPPTPAATPAPAPAPAIPGTISLGHVSPNAPVAVRGAKDSIFNSRSFNAEVMNFEFWLRERAGLTDKDDIRAAVFAGLLAVAKAPTPKDRVLLDGWPFKYGKLA